MRKRQCIILKPYATPTGKETCVVRHHDLLPVHECFRNSSSPLCILQNAIPIGDVRNMIYAYLDEISLFMLMRSHDIKLQRQVDDSMFNQAISQMRSLPIYLELFAGTNHISNLTDHIRTAIKYECFDILDHLWGNYSAHFTMLHWMKAIGAKQEEVVSWLLNKVMNREAKRYELMCMVINDYDAFHWLLYNTV